MKRYKHERVFIVRVSRLNSANAVLESLGYGPDNFSIPLGSVAGKPTHYGCQLRLTDADLATFRSAAGAQRIEENIAQLPPGRRMERAASRHNLKTRPEQRSMR